ncbi:hypothetical protein [Phenylobacterium soli]|uniref:Uncharacterized protein n=1 Tax=Phenylobacterium soli TaxID=2170551 RepID=A0A328ABM1_9CAUL|nr:hypothetical protein [Phenylobacterium soli]RAK51616.1 hypothetical protein DJ017_17425 [Phenylobacterium soli]
MPLIEQEEREMEREEGVQPGASRAAQGPDSPATTSTGARSGAFTPGRHQVGPSLYEGFVACVYVDNPDGTMTTLAEVRRYKDAVLYAAAPDLLEALIALLTHRRDPDPAQSIEAVEARANAAIAKATGASHG